MNKERKSKEIYYVNGKPAKWVYEENIVFTPSCKHKWIDYNLENGFDTDGTLWVCATCGILVSLLDGEKE